MHPFFPLYQFPSNGPFPIFYESLVHRYLKFIHDLADAFATGSNDAGMNSAVQGDVFRDHLFKLIHNSLNGITCCYGFMLIPSNGNLVLRNGGKFNMKFHYLYSIFIKLVNKPPSVQTKNIFAQRNKSV